MIQVKNVTKYFDDFKVLDDFSLNVKRLYNIYWGNQSIELYRKE